jgi:4-aminobutyrate aminotransferase-like enzyme
MAAAQAVLTTIVEGDLKEHARVVGAKLLTAFRSLGDIHPSVGDVRGAGLFIGFELVSDRGPKRRTTPWRCTSLRRFGKTGCSRPPPVPSATS